MWNYVEAKLPQYQPVKIFHPLGITQHASYMDTHIISPFFLSD